LSYCFDIPALTFTSQSGDILLLVTLLVYLRKDVTPPLPSLPDILTVYMLAHSTGAIGALWG